MTRRLSVYGLRGGVGFAVGLGLMACSGNTPLPTTPPEPPEDREPPGQAGPPIAPNSPFAAPAVTSTRPPPALSGGTLLSLKDGKTAVASDADRDAVFVVDVRDKQLLSTVQLAAGDEPGRAVEDSRGDVHVILRNSGRIVTLRAGDFQVAQRRNTCPAPRGIAFDGSALWVACAGGELQQFGLTDAQPKRSFFVERDLRDVIATGGTLLVTRFRSAEILTISPETGEVKGRAVPPGSRISQQKGIFKSREPVDPNLRAAEPNVAWRMRPLPSGGAVIIHQESSNAPLGLKEGGYSGGACASAVGAAVTTIDKDGTIATSGQFMMAALPVDVAVSPAGRQVAMVFAGNDPRASSSRPVVWMDREVANQNDCMAAGDGGGGFTGAGGSTGSGGAGATGGGQGGQGGTPGDPPEPEPEELPAPEPVESVFVGKEPIAVAFDGEGRLLVQSREPAVLTIVGPGGGEVVLSKVKRVDSGFDVFHKATNAGIACASCHPEGGDDGRAWRFEQLGRRRTQNLRGGIMHLAPFHWDGDMKDMSTLMREVFSGRMQGQSLPKPYVDALTKYIDALPLLPNGAPRDLAAVERGAKLFRNAEVGCATCHSGRDLTTNATMDVGTGHAVQVPSLKGIGFRAPFMHTGCAKTLQDRFDPKCGGGDKHGVTSHLSAGQIADLSAYMETL